MRALLSGAVLAMVAMQLGGCVAAALVPIAASGAVVKRTADFSQRKSALKPVVTVGGKEAEQPPALAPTQAAIVPAMVIEPSAPEQTADDPYAALSAFVITAADSAKPGTRRRSALIEQRSLATMPELTGCTTDQRSALLIDLDIGAKPFDMNDPPSPAPGLADTLRTIRGTGTAVVWVASLPESDGADLATMLTAIGLDPLGIDRTALLRGRETRKQQILNRLVDDWCVLAIAGDQRGDFDEVFDYLRNPDSPIALALEQHIGVRWFLVPPPIR